MAEEKTPHQWHNIQGLIFIAFSLMSLLSLLSFAFDRHSPNWIGLVGYSLGWLLHTLFGITSYLIVLFSAWVGGGILFFGKPTQYVRIKAFYFSIFLISICILSSLFEQQFPKISDWIKWLFYPESSQSKSYHLGGLPFYYLYSGIPYFNLQHIFNTIGVAIIFTSTALASLLFFMKANLYDLVIWTKERWFNTKAVVAEGPSKYANDFMRYVKLRMAETEVQGNPKNDFLAIQPEIDLKSRPSLSKKTQIPQLEEKLLEQPSVKEESRPEPPQQPKPVKKKEAAIAAQRVHNGDFTNYKMPPLSLITPAKKVDQSSLKKDLRKQAEVLEETLMSFGIEAKVGQINCGPTIISFEVHPSIGVKVQRIRALENDIALNMEAKSIRIIAPIPGKAAVGIEVPNPYPQEVGFKDMLQSYQQNPNKFKIPVLLGKAVNGDYVMSDLTKMPHCIIAGATGSGKSVCINTIIMTILYTSKPDQVQLVMVDPKKVELTPYTNLPHMLAPVITEPHGAYSALQWLVKEMETRYEILKQLGLRNIEAFNNRTINKELEASLNLTIPEKMPYLVGIIDELADLMLSSNMDIETPIARLAQMARAIGIHMILATQRPSREVITGLIKANFPVRISFKVASRVNSQIILDDTGAESLLGNGDMLFLPPGTSQLMRAQGAYVRDEDIHAAIKFICEQAPPNYRIPSFDDMIVPTNESEKEDSFSPSGNGKDTLYDQALDIVTSTGNASTTFLQRKLKIGYARAASLMDELHEKGVVSAAEGSRPRRVLKAKGNSDLEEEL